VDFEEPNGAVGLKCSQDEKFATKSRDPFRPEVDRSDDDAPKELMFCVVGHVSASGEHPHRKSTFRRHAGFRASGKGSTSVIRPTRRSRVKKVSARTSGFGERLAGSKGRLASVDCASTMKSPRARGTTDSRAPKCVEGCVAAPECWSEF
jgi:hypothetical protein